MAKELRCGDIMPGCKAVFEGKNNQEVLKKAEEHVKNVHSVANMPPDVSQKVLQAIRNK